MKKINIEKILKENDFPKHFFPRTVFAQKPYEPIPPQEYIWEKAIPNNDEQETFEMIISMSFSDLEITVSDLIEKLSKINKDYKIVIESAMYDASNISIKKKVKDPKFDFLYKKYLSDLDSYKKEVEEYSLREEMYR
jgi:hypothetical protein